MRQVTKKLTLATLRTFDGADHSFKAGKTVVIPELVAETKAWLEKKT
jgi:hypothetical protein